MMEVVIKLNTRLYILYHINEMSCPLVQVTCGVGKCRTAFTFLSFQLGAVTFPSDWLPLYK